MADKVIQWPDKDMNMKMVIARDDLWKWLKERGIDIFRVAFVYSFGSGTVWFWYAWGWWWLWLFFLGVMVIIFARKLY